MKSEADRVEMLLRLVRGELSGKRKAEMEAAIRSDAEISALYHIIRELSSLRSDLQSSGAVAAAKKLSGRLYQDYLRDRGDCKGNHGITIFDSKDIPLPAGIRPAAVDTRKLKYKLGKREIAISLYPVTPDSYELLGQILGVTPGRSLQIRLRSCRLSRQTALDEFYLFRFARVPTGKYTVSILEGGKVAGSLELQL